jgi:signal peptidase I
VQVRAHRAWIDGEPVEPEGQEIPYLTEERLRDLRDSMVMANWPQDPTDCAQHKLGPQESIYLHHTPLEPVMTASGLGCRVPEGAYFMMGDNRFRSSDSRIWGALPRGLVKGRAWLIWYSYREDAGDHRRTGAKRLYSMVKKVFLFPMRTNWKRLFTVIH